MMRLVPSLLAAVVLLAAPVDAQPVAKEPPPDVTGTLRIDRRAGTIDVRLTHRMAVDTASAVRFLLNPAFPELHVHCGACEPAVRDSAWRGLAVFRVPLRTGPRAGERISVTTQNAGPLATFRDSASGFIELNLDDFWHPVRMPIGEHRFASSIRVIVGDTAGVRIAGSGSIVPHADGWTITSYGAGPDIALALGPRLETWSARAPRTRMPLAVVARPEASAVAQAVLGQVASALGVLDSLLGPARAWDAAGVTVLLRPAGVGAGRGGYSRTGYFVLPEMADTNAYIAHVTHELAHGWLLGAERRHAWLDESMAEYTSVLAMRTLRSPAAADSMLAEKRKRVAGLPPLLGYDRDANPRLTPRMLYDKGPLLLAELHAAIGDAAFLRFLRAAAEARPRTTDAALAVLARSVSADAAARFREILARE